MLEEGNADGLLQRELPTVISNSEETRLEQGQNAEPAAEDVNATLMGEDVEEKFKVAGVVLRSLTAVKKLTVAICIIAILTVWNAERK